MTIQVNGEPFQTEKQLSVTELLKEARVEAPEYVTVQLNQQFVVDFLYYMGGGSR